MSHQHAGIRDLRLCPRASGAFCLYCRYISYTPGWWFQMYSNVIIQGHVHSKHVIYHCFSRLFFVVVFCGWFKYASHTLMWGYSGMVIMVKSSMFLAVKSAPKMCFVKPEIRLDMNRIWLCICFFAKNKKTLGFPTNLYQTNHRKNWGISNHGSSRAVQMMSPSAVFWWM